MAVDADQIGNLREYVGNGPQDFQRVGSHLGGAEIKDGPVLAVDDLNAEPVLSYFDGDAVGEPVKLLIGGNQLLYLPFDVFKYLYLLGSGQFQHVCCLRRGQILLVLILLQHGKIETFVDDTNRLPVQIKHVGRPAITQAGDAARVGKITGDNALFQVRGALDQPQDQEEGHHGQREVREGDLPGPTMYIGAAFAHALDDDGVFGSFHGFAAPGRWALAPGLQGLATADVFVELEKAGTVA